MRARPAPAQVTTPGGEGFTSSSETFEASIARRPDSDNWRVLRGAFRKEPVIIRTTWAGGMSAKVPDPHGAVRVYFERLPPESRARLEQLRAAVLSAAPGKEETISYGIPTVRHHGSVVHYAAFRDHVSFFPGSATTRLKFARELRPFLGGKGTVRFPLDRPIPMGLVRRIVRTRVRENEARAEARAQPRPKKSRRSLARRTTR